MNRSDVLIIGGGPSGVAAALALKAAGIKHVTLLDRNPDLGGATRHCSHSPFGMLEYKRPYFGAAYGRRLERDARAAGVDVRTGHSVTRLGSDGVIEVANAQGVQSYEGDRILLATGARELSRAARFLPGDRPVGVLTTGALQSYVAFHGLIPFRRPVILGSELVAMSAVATCLTHGARPVAVLEQGAAPLVRAPFAWFPKLAGIPFLTGVTVLDICGRDRIDTVKILHNGAERTLDCDGLLLCGNFTPEAALLWQAGQTINRGSGGPSVDQSGRCADTRYFAAGNLLRPIETGGWAYREGRVIGQAMALDIMQGPSAGEIVPVETVGPLKLVVPDMIRRGEPFASGFDRFQLRVTNICRGTVRVEIDGKTAQHKRGVFYPERRILLPMPAAVTQANTIRIVFEPED